MEAITNSVLLFAVAGAIGRVVERVRLLDTAVACLVLMACCNTVFGLMRGATGVAGMEFVGSLANNVATFAGIPDIPLGFITFGVVIHGALSGRRA